MEICTTHPGVRVAGLDFSPRMLAIGQRKGAPKGCGSASTSTLGMPANCLSRLHPSTAHHGLGIRNIGAGRGSGGDPACSQKGGSTLDHGV